MHCHTVRSDGNDTPEELIEAAVRVGLHAVAITDHDIPPPRTIGDEEAAAYAAGRGVRLMLGYEFSCDTLVDDVHLCGYGLDWGRPELAEEVAAARRSKSDAYRDLCERLTAAGMPLDWDADILNCTDANGNPATRTAEEVQRKHVFEAMAARGHAATWSDAKLLVRDNPDLNAPRRKIDPVDAIGLIKTCGGVAVLAHPYLIDETIDAADRPATRQAYIDMLLAAGLDGIEARYTYDKTSYKGTLSPEQIEAEVLGRYAPRVRFLSGGSDYHADHKKGAKNARRLGERGLTVDEFNVAFGSRV